MAISAEIKEQIVNSYRKLFDLELAYDRHRLTLKQRAELQKDVEFQDRLECLLTQEKEELYLELKGLTQTAVAADATRLKAIIELGKILYPSRFVPGYDEETGDIAPERMEVSHNFSISPDGGTAEILKILSESSGIKSTVKRSPKT